MQYYMSDSFLFAFLSVCLLAYRLQFCLPPPIIPNAEILMASKEFKIGEFELILHNLQSDLYSCFCAFVLVDSAWPSISVTF